MKSDTQQIYQAKRLERIFIYHRWLYMAAVLLSAWLYDLKPMTAIILLVLGLGASNIVAFVLNPRLKTGRNQTALGISMLMVDTLAVGGLTLFFIYDYHSVVYAAFALIIIEAAIKFGLWGSLITFIFFAIVILATWLYRSLVLGAGPEFPGFIFWLGVLSLVAMTIGMVVREAQKQRRYAESLAAEKALLLERRRISGELHDSVLKSLQGLALEAHVLSRGDKNCEVPPAVADRAHYIEEVCNRMSQDIRGVVCELYKDDDTPDEVITQKIARQLDNWSKKTGIPGEFKYSGDIPALPLKLTHGLYRITGEALINVQQHAVASSVDLSLSAANGQLTYNIVDNGCGFDIDSNQLYSFVKKGKLGLVSMKERVELAGGRLSIESNSKGTRLSVIIPIPKNKDRAGM